MTTIDILLGAFLAYGFYKGFRNGLFVELSALVSFLIGLLLAIKFSSWVGIKINEILHYDSKNIKIIAFVLTFVLVVVGIYFLAKILTQIANWSNLGIANNLAGGAVRIIKTTLILSVMIHMFNKLNFNNTFVSKNTLNESLFFNPIQEVSQKVTPSIEEIFQKTISKV